MAEKKPLFSHLPMSREEARGVGDFDIILVSGDAYVDHPAFGVPLVARHLEAHGFKVGLIAQPDWRSKEPFMVLGRPRLFFGVGAGAMDSMVAHYTPARKLRHDDAYTPGGKHGARPNRATIVYTSRLKEAYPGTPVILGGIEASLRRLAHYDFWEDKVRRGILFDAKADMVVYGMAEAPILEIAERMNRGEGLAQIQDVRGTCYITKGKPGEITADPGAENPETKEAPVKAMSPEDGIWIPSFEEVSVDKVKYTESVRLAFHEHNPHRARPLWQMHGTRVLVVRPPALPLTEAEMDALYDLPFTRVPHPRYQGVLTAYEQIKDSITTHRGCFGGCSFCAITSHQGKTIQSRSRESVLREVRELSRKSFFRGSLSDVGGPTANMYGLHCGDEKAETMCLRESCLFPTTCKNLVTGDEGAVALLREVRSVPGVKHVAVSSGVRYDLMDAQPDYFEELAEHHVGGLLKVAPEHLVDRITDVMRKPGRKHFDKFLAWYREKNQEVGKRQSVVPYLISGHPGCTLEDMVELAFALKKLGLKVEQVQDFTPTPGTLATAMFHTGIDPITGKKVYVARTDREKAMQKALLLWHLPEYHPKIKDAFREIGRGDVGRLIG